MGQASSPYIKDASTDALTSTNDYIETDPVFVGDIDGNGRADMIVHWTSSSGSRQLLTYKANSNGTYNSGVNYSTSNSHNPSVYAGTFLVADIKTAAILTFSRIAARRLVPSRPLFVQIRLLVFRITTTIKSSILHF